MRLSLIFFFLFCAPAYALEFKKIDNNQYEMIGFFDKYSYVKIRDFLRENKGKDLIIIPFSHGGYANDIFDIMREFKNHGSVTFNVNPNMESYCHSMCAYAAAAAYKRYGKFGYHPLAPTSSIDIQAVRDINNTLKEYLIYYGMDKSLAHTATLSQSSELQYVIFNGGWK